MPILCKIFGHKFSIHFNADEMWIACDRKGCDCQKDVPKEREEEAYLKLSTGDLNWKE